MDNLDTEDFIHAVFSDGVSGYLATGRIGDHGSRDISKTTFWNWPSESDALLKWVKVNSDEDIYFSPMLYSEKRRTKESVSHTPVLWADTDEADPMDFDLEPSIVIETSPGRYQALWCMEEPVTPYWAEEMSKRITYSRIEQGSDYGWALTKYLRIPGSINTKPHADGFIVRAFVPTGRIYTVADIEAQYGNPDTPSVAVIARELPDDMPRRADVLARIPYDAFIERALNSEDKIRSRSETLWWLECQLFREGLTAEEVYVAVKGTPNDKYTQDGRPETELWADVLRAQRAVAADQVSYTGPGIDKADVIQSAPRPELLTTEERDDLPRTFIDDYVEWAAGKTNGDVGYQEFGAMCCMSTVLADFGCVTPSFGKLRLNMWFMILGITTRTYKTTAKKLMLEILDMITRNTNYEYDMGSDTTPEGLLLELSEHPNRSVLFHRDEANAMLHDAKGGKSYMSGFGEALTELYDGHVRGRLRATGSKKKVAATETSFNLMLLGVPEKLASVLTVEDFASGFLARFAYVVGRPEPYTKETAYLHQLDDKAMEVDDIARTALCDTLLKARSFWSKRTSPGNLIPVRATPAAWERFNKALMDLDALAQSSPVSKVMEPCANRMNKMVLKLAALLAMVDCRTEIGLTDMLIAISYSEKWYQNLDTVVNMVGRTEFGARVEDLVGYVQGKPKTYVAVRRHFKNMTQREWTDVLTAAQDQQLIKIEGNGNARVILSV